MSASAALTQPVGFKEAADNTDAIRASDVFVVNAPVAAVLHALEHAETYRYMFPRVLNAREIGRTKRGERLVELEQGTPLFRARYTVRVRREGDTLVYLWLDPDFDHDIRNAQGLFLLEPVGPAKTKLTLHVLVDLGPEPWKAFFRARVQEAFQATPRLMARYLETPPAAALSPAPAEPTPVR